MSEGIIFNPDQKDIVSSHTNQNKAKGLAGWLVNKSAGLIKTEQQANIVLTLFALVCFVLALIIPWLW